MIELVWIDLIINSLVLVVLGFIAWHLHRRAKTADEALRLLRRIARRDERLEL
jgi:hypothetical protein